MKEGKMNKIEQELKVSKKYYLGQKKSRELVDLTSDNVARIEAMIVNDSDYATACNPDVDSTAKWMIELRKCLMENSSKYKFDEIVENCVKYVDKENSTHLNADGVGIKELTERIKNMKTTLLNDLKNPQNNGYRIIKDLSEATNPNPQNNNGKKYHPRKNYSFASKFCHYACFYLFKGLNEQDNFSIYDNIVANSITKYASLYNINMDDYKNFRSDYSSYIKLVDAIIEASGNKISRNGFDHLLWYFHKARPITKKKRTKKTNKQ